jgi:hypothetical protein
MIQKADQVETMNLGRKELLPLIVFEKLIAFCFYKFYEITLEDLDFDPEILLNNKAQLDDPQPQFGAQKVKIASAQKVKIARVQAPFHSASEYVLYNVYNFNLRSV